MDTIRASVSSNKAFDSVVFIDGEMLELTRVNSSSRF